MNTPNLTVLVDESIDDKPAPVVAAKPTTKNNNTQIIIVLVLLVLIIGVMIWLNYSTRKSNIDAGN